MPSLISVPLTASGPVLALSRPILIGSRCAWASDATSMTTREPTSTQERRFRLIVLSSWQFGPTNGPGPQRLEGRRGAQHEHVFQAAADDLQPHRQAARRPARRNRDRRLAAVVEGIAERPAEMRDLAPGHLGGADHAERERRQTERGREQEVVALEESPERIRERLSGRHGL